MSSKIKLIKSSGIYGIVQVLQKCIGLILIPIYTVLLSPDEKGITDVITTIVAFFSIFYSLALNSAVIRFYVDYKNDEKKLKDFWGTCITFVIINSVVLTAIIIIFRNIIIIPITGGIDFYPYILLGLISIALNPIFTIFQSTLQAKEESRRYALNNLSYFLVNLSLNLIFIVGFRLGALGSLLALAITDVIFFIYTIINFLSLITLKINKEYLKSALKYSLPLLPHSLSGWAVSMLDRLFLNGLISRAATSIYSTAAQFGNIINVLTSAINQAYVPWFFQQMKDKKKNEDEIVKMAELLTIIYCFLAMGMSLFGPEIFKLVVNIRYYEGWKVIPFISFAFVFNGIYYFFVNPLFYNKKGVKYIAIGTFTGALLNSIFNIIMIPKMGEVGAAIASLLSMAISCVLVYFISKRIEPLKFNILKMLLFPVVFLLISLLAFKIDTGNLILSILIKLCIVFIMAIIMMLIYRSDIYKLYMEVKNRK
ncbi:lipopolysaccharide biosynthesis protein [Clostridium sartagoforme]|uniref:lipopolysaccharide biosynthesis protein n=1 Tax=Clostridium sartagoforme TaxID=84031 RepID=UPI0031DD6B7A